MSSPRSSQPSAAHHGAAGRKALGRLALFFGSLLPALVLLESVLLLFHPQTLEQEEWDPLLRFRNLPDSIKPMRVEGESAQVVFITVNHDGFRGQPQQSRPGRRIVVLGDSFVFGHGVADEETFCAQLEKRSRVMNPTPEVVNAGVKGYSPDQYYLFIKTRSGFVRIR